MYMTKSPSLSGLHPVRSLSPTSLRKNLFQTLKRVSKGETIVVETADGDIVLSARKHTNANLSGKSKVTLQPKIPGRIIGSLDSADAALRKYLQMPT